MALEQMDCICGRLRGDELGLSSAGVKIRWSYGRRAGEGFIGGEAGAARWPADSLIYTVCLVSVHSAQSHTHTHRLTHTHTHTDSHTNRITDKCHLPVNSQRA